MRYPRIILLCVLFSTVGFSQQNDHEIRLDRDPISKQNISEQDLEHYLNDEEFNYQTEEAETSVISDFLQWLTNALNSFFESIFGAEIASSIVLFLIRVVPYLLLAFLIFLLLRFFLKTNSNRIIGRTQAKGEVQLSEDEEIIKNEDIQALIQSAIQSGNFRLAIRYYYLLVLRELSRNEKINWEPQKTNEDYLKELQETNIRSGFEEITRMYDHIWYGEFAIDASSFAILKNDFENLNSMLNS